MDRDDPGRLPRKAMPYAGTGRHSLGSQVIVTSFGLVFDEKENYDYIKFGISRNTIRLSDRLSDYHTIRLALPHILIVRY